MTYLKNTKTQIQEWKSCVSIYSSLQSFDPLWLKKGSKGLLASLLETLTMFDMNIHHLIHCRLKV